MGVMLFLNVMSRMPVYVEYIYSLSRGHPPSFAPPLNEALPVVDPEGISIF